MDSYLIFLILSLLLVVSCAAPISEEERRRDVGEYGNHFEGDMLLTARQRKEIEAAMDVDGETRNGVRNPANRWPNATVVYHIEERDFDEDQLMKIENALADISNKSCIKFRKREKEDEHAVIIQGSGNGCYSNVGLNNADDDGEVHQVLNLSPGCFRHGTVVHEMLHTLGFYHMQSTYDRDEFITIVWENILPGTEHNFAKYNNDTVTDYGVPYDYGSVMHYSETAFSKNGNRTIIPLQGSDEGCFSTVGYNNPKSEGYDDDDDQVLNLGEGCFKHGVIVHEMLHTLGFHHMQSTYDRDEFVTIVWRNIQPGHEHNFNKYNNDTLTDFGVPYDYGSVMHYSETAFSKYGFRTIVPKKEGAQIGQRVGMSERDTLKLNKMYCKDEVPPKTSESGGIEEAIKEIIDNV